MTNAIDNAKRIIGERVELFARNREQYRNATYKEAQLRAEFLDPFFAALGWDVAAMPRNVVGCDQDVECGRCGMGRLERICGSGRFVIYCFLSSIEGGQCWNINLIISDSGGNPFTPKAGPTAEPG